MALTPVVIGVAGGTGSGKTTVAEQILRRAGAEWIALIQHDSYYKDLSHLPLAQRAMTNFDHPDALDNALLIEHLKRLKAGLPVEVPVYDFTTHTRTGETRLVEPHRVVVVEGILIFSDPELRRLMDVKIYVDTDPDIRFIRRLQRDIAERGRTMDSVIRQYRGGDGHDRRPAQDAARRRRVRAGFGRRTDLTNPGPSGTLAAL